MMKFISDFRNKIAENRYIFPILCLLFLFSCKTNERIIYQTRTETVRDTIVILEPDSSVITLLLECDSVNNVIIKNLLEYKGGYKLHPPDISIDNNVLTAKCKTDTIIYSFPIYTIDIKEKEVEIIDNTRHRFGEDFFYFAGIFLLLVFVTVSVIKIAK